MSIESVRCRTQLERLMPSAEPKMLEGIRIIDLTSVVFGPYATKILVDLGAEVTKVEPPSGDQFRFSAKSAKSHGMSPGYLALNRGKKSIILDLKEDEGKAVMRELIASSDIFIHNVRSKAIARLGFDYESVRQIKHDIIYVHCVGFGSNGPYAEFQAYDDVIQAATGAATLTPRVDGDPRPRYIPSLIADKVAGLHGGYAMLAALVHRFRTGEGQSVEVPMFETFTHFLLQEHLDGATFDPAVGTVGYSRQLDPNRQPFPTADGYISIVPYTDEAVGRVLEALGAGGVLEQARFSTRRSRAENMSEIYAEMSKFTPSRPTREWIAIFDKLQIPAMPVRDLADIMDDPHLHQVGFFERTAHPTEGNLIEMAPPVRFSAYAPPGKGGAPLLGEDSAAVRAALRGYA